MDLQGSEPREAEIFNGRAYMSPSWKQEIAKRVVKPIFASSLSISQALAELNVARAEVTWEVLK